MKKFKKVTAAVIGISAVLGAALMGGIIAASVWANRPRGIRIPLDDIH